jgi:hypothetical protein
MANLDLKKELKHLYAPSASTVAVADVPEFNYLVIDGEGNPNTDPAYARAIQALYPLAYGVRGICKAAGNIFTVMPMEGLWWFKGAAIEDFQMTEADKDRFVWRLMIMQPLMVSSELVGQARATVQKKGAPVMLDQVRFEPFHEGEAVQILHIGPYNAEGPNIEKLHRHIHENGWRLSGKHHEIYLSDPRKVAPDKMKTVIRQPFSRG